MTFVGARLLGAGGRPLDCMTELPSNCNLFGAPVWLMGYTIIESVSSARETAIDVGCIDRVGLVCDYW